jgi:hypothetical protein
MQFVLSFLSRPRIRKRGPDPSFRDCRTGLAVNLCTILSFNLHAKANGLLEAIAIMPNLILSRCTLSLSYDHLFDV